PTMTMGESDMGRDLGAGSRIRGERRGRGSYGDEPRPERLDAVLFTELQRGGVVLLADGLGAAVVLLADRGRRVVATAATGHLAQLLDEELLQLLVLGHDRFVS